MKNYQLAAPLFFVGQDVSFTHHNKNKMVGTIVYLETHYTRALDGEMPKGYHIYAIKTPTSKKGRSVWIGEDSIHCVVPFI